MWHCICLWLCTCGIVARIEAIGYCVEFLTMTFVLFSQLQCVVCLIMVSSFAVSGLAALVYMGGMGFCLSGSFQAGGGGGVFCAQEG